jgi:hypothetical protein
MVSHHRLVHDQIYQIFDDPGVYLFKASFDGGNITRKLSKILRPGDWCFESLMWFFNWEIAKVRYKIWKHLQSLGVNYIVMANSPVEVWRCRALGIPVRLMPQGQFINENVFTPASPNRVCQYDAFYAAQARTFKRLHLAKSIKKLYVLTYACPKNALGENDLSIFEPKVSHADWNKRYIHDLEDIIKLMHQSRCALALSRVEGAMWASLEALLCGIPVVSTRSQGGRQRYFTKENSSIVRPTSTAVAIAVGRYQTYRPDPREVRASVIRQLDLDRNKTAEFFSEKVLNCKAWSPEKIKSHLFGSQAGVGQFLL